MFFCRRDFVFSNGHDVFLTNKQTAYEHICVHRMSPVHTLYRENLVCSGMDVVRNSQKLSVRVVRGKYTPLGEEFDLKRRISSNLHGTFSRGQRPRGNPWLCGQIVDDHHRGGKSCTSQRVATGATAALTTTYRS